MKKDMKKPFFARLLEEQELEQVSGGIAQTTLKYPSDSDESTASVVNPPEQTQKFPSDGDEAEGI
ncbi:microviridin/marinostatin family tricyclic proteinase inhibitor [Vitiosangium sp. GDMCC 1.1324]|uniref:microviridin/marinostatin family tricyclic proteinase inhibitor n=1 Tax=Vitiosangium sp. (strain GDMCC 1.1324) TaxID=2138576 RepID=UPI000D384E20|nr:microviridin/marinostatin family tricyclic proteinase inhibitor [Vitiosangium sp. GDMCC 1.1324]PTL79433.1 hypothetical protein DAT35_35170 [Vitiosangium sp. GDMCC 1.1324]